MITQIVSIHAFNDIKDVTNNLLNLSKINFLDVF